MSDIFEDEDEDLEPLDSLDPFFSANERRDKEIQGQESARRRLENLLDERRLRSELDDFVD